LVVNGERGI